MSETTFLSDVLTNMIFAPPRQPRFARCQFEEPESQYAACDAMRCYAPATVFNLTNDMEVCQGHHQRLEMDAVTERMP